MKSTRIVLIASLVACTRLTAADPAAEVVGVQVVTKAHGAEGSMKTAPFDAMEPGIEIALGLTSEKGGIIAIDEDASEVATLVDDKGTNLLVKEFGRKGFGSFSRVSDDKTFGLITITTNKLAGEGATKLMATGKVMATTAASKKTERSKPVELKEGETLELGAIKFKILRSESGDDSTQITLETNNPVETLAEIRFIGEGDKKLESDRNGSSSSGFAGKYTYTLDYSITGKVAKVTLEADIWQDAKKVEIPFDFTVALPVVVAK